MAAGLRAKAGVGTGARVALERPDPLELTDFDTSSPVGKSWLIGKEQRFCLVMRMRDNAFASIGPLLALSFTLPLRFIVKTEEIAERGIIGVTTGTSE